MPVYYLAIDIGASSGRHMAAWRDEAGNLHMREVYRFANLPRMRDGHLTWDLERLQEEVLAGLRACKEEDIIPRSVGIDTWAVDYVLLDAANQPLPPLYCYRDERGNAAAKRVHQMMPFQQLYARTGIQFQPFNTVYQLFDDLQTGRLDRAADFLLLPEYLSFFLSGRKAHESTNASTTGLMNAQTRLWDMDIVRTLGLPERLFSAQPQTPPLPLGTLRPEIAQTVGFSCDVVLPATHDTASAIAALPRKGAYISSGTWSLLGAEIEWPITTPDAMRANFTNEGGVGDIRFLKNIMGLWLVQCLRHELADAYSFAELADMARQEAAFDYHLDVNAPRYLAPESVRAEISEECREKGWPVPQTPGQYAHAIFQSLAHAYAEALAELERVTGQHFDTLCIVGGGVKNTYLNELTERAIGRRVITGSPEATALGNILLQEAAYV